MENSMNADPPVVNLKNTECPTCSQPIKILNGYLENQYKQKREMKEKLLKMCVERAKFENMETNERITD